MTEGQLERVKELLETLADRRLDEAAQLLEGDPPVIRQEVLRLLQLRAEKGAFLETPAILFDSAEEPSGFLGLVLEGRFVLERVLGIGGFGTAYLAHDKRLRREVVVKILHRGVSSEGSSAKEIEALSKIEHPGVAGILDAGRTPDGRAFLVTRFVAGSSLRKLLEDGRAFSEAETTQFGLQLAEALSFAHRRGVLHLDVTPENILIEELGAGETRAVILDFGVAQFRDSLEGNTAIFQLGPTKYRAPELVRGEPGDWSSDLYSVAVVMREMLAGSAVGVSNGTNSKHWERFFRRALASSISDRYATPEAFREALLPSQPWKKLAAAVALVVVAAGAGAALLQRNKSELTLPVSYPRPLTTLRGDETNPSLSPDGQVVYFSWARDGKERDICRIRPGEQAPTCLTSHPAGDTEVKCSPDGKLLAFLRDGDGGRNSVMLIPASGGAEVTIGEGYFNSLAWSRDAKMLVASDADGPGIGHNLRVLKLAERTWREVTKTPESTLGDVYPSFSPDGKELTFVRFINRAKAQVLAVSIDEEVRPLSSPRVLVELSGDIRHPVWSDDGKSVLFLFGTPSNHSLWRVPAMGDRPAQRLPEAGINLSHLAIAGRTLVMTRAFSDSDIWRSDMATPGGPVVKTVRLAGSTHVDEEPRISPDGQRVLFESDRTGEPQYWLSDIDGNRHRQITNFPKASFPALKWIPGHSELLLTGLFQGSQALRLVDLDLKDLAPMRELPFQKPLLIGVSRDGKFCYLTALRTGRVKILRLSLETLQATEVAEASAVSAIESHDGKTLYYCSRQASLGLWRVPVTGGQPERVLENVHRRSFAVGRSGVYYVSRANDRAIAYRDFQNRTSRTLLETAGPLSWGIDLSLDERTIVYTTLVHDGADLQTVQLTSPTYD